MLEFDGRPFPVSVAFYTGQSHRFAGCGHRRPRKVRGTWVVRKWSDRPLLVRTDRDPALPEFVAAI